MYKLKEKDVQFELIAHPEETPIKGNVMDCGKDQEDHKAEQMVQEQLESGNMWAWCTVEVKATWQNFTYSDFIGCCSFKSQQDFEQLYYDDMAQTCLAELNEMVANTFNKLAFKGATDDQLQKELNNRGWLVIDKWHRDDIIYKAEDMKIILNEDQIEAIADSIKKNHDPTTGINWDVLEFWINEQIAISPTDES